MNPHSKILLVYYSRTGTTREVARAIAGILDCDVEELIDRRDRSGLLGYHRPLLDSLLSRPADLRPATYDPANYSLVIVA